MRCGERLMGALSAVRLLTARRAACVRVCVFARAGRCDSSAARHRFGLLEKHKDYVERAKDYHRKEVSTQSTKNNRAPLRLDGRHHCMHRRRT